MTLLMVSYIICLVLSFFISTQEFAHNYLQINKSLLYSKNFYFNLYGFVHGLISCAMLWFIIYKGIINGSDNISVILTSIGIGLGIKGFTNISFFDKKIDDTNTIHYGPKDITQKLEKYLKPVIIRRHDMAIKEIIQNRKTYLSAFDEADIKGALVKYLPLDEKKGGEYVRESYIRLVPEWGLFEVQESYIEKYGISRYKTAIKSLNNKN